MNAVYQGVLNGVIRQMPIAAWFNAQCKRIQLTIVLPSDDPSLLRRTSTWPFRLPQEIPALRPPNKSTFIRLRKRGQSKHILGGLQINWELIDQNLWTRGPTVLDRDGLYRQFFLHRNSSTTDGVYKGEDSNRWTALLWASQSAQPPRMALGVSSWILWGQTNYQAYQEWLD